MVRPYSVTPSTSNVLPPPYARDTFWHKVEIWETFPGVHTHGAHMLLCFPNEGLCLSTVSGWGIERESLVQPRLLSKFLLVLQQSSLLSLPPVLNFLAARSLALRFQSRVSASLTLEASGPIMGWAPAPFNS